MSEKRAMFKRSVETDILIRLLKQAKVGEVVPYDALDAALGISARPGGPGYGASISARNILLSEDQVLFVCVPKVGLKRCMPAEFVNRAQELMMRANRQTSKAVRVVSAIDSAELDADAAKELAVITTQIGLVKAILRAEGKKTITKQIGVDNKPLPKGIAMKLFAKE